MNERKNISFRLLNINTEEFATFEIENPSENPDLKVDLQFSVSNDQNAIACKMSFQFVSNQQLLLVLKVVCTFNVEKTSWETQILGDNKITLPKHFLDHLCVITVGTARGILHTKTENTTFNKYMIPTLNVSSLVEKDVVFDIK